MKTTKFRSVVGGTALLVLAGCSAKSQSPAEGTEARSQSALSAADACAADYAKRAAGPEHCAGGWEYPIACAVQKAGDRCDVIGYEQKQVQRPYLCEAEHFGIKSVGTHSETVTAPWTSQLVTQLRADEACRVYFRDHRKAEILAGKRMDPNGERARALQLRSAKGRLAEIGTWSIPCDYVIDNYPTFRRSDEWVDQNSEESYAIAVSKCGGYTTLVEDKDRPRYAECRSWDYGIAPASTCPGSTVGKAEPGTLSNKLLSDVEGFRRLSDLSGAEARSLGYVEPSCSTCDNETIPDNRYVCFHNSWERYGLHDSPENLPRIAQHTKAYLENEGGGLSRAAREDLYGWAYQYVGAGAEPSCAPAEHLNAACMQELSDNGETIAVTAARYCDALLTRGQADALGGLVGDCLRAITTVDAYVKTRTDDPTCTQDVGAPNEWALALLGKRLGIPVGAASSAEPTSEHEKESAKRRGIAERLADLSDWYAWRRADLSLEGAPSAPDTPNATTLTGELSRALKAFWKGVYGSELPTLGANATDADVKKAIARVQEITGQDTLADREVVAQIFAEPLGQGAPVALSVLADVLEQLAASLEDREAAVDLACVYVGCDEAPPIVAHWQVLGALADGTAFASAAASTQLSEAWGQAFKTLAAQHARFRESVRIAAGADTYSPSLLQTVPAFADPGLARVAAVIAKGRARSETFARGRSLRLGGGNAVYGGLSTTQSLAAYTRGITQKDTLVGAVNRDDDTVRTVFSDLLQQVSVETKRTELATSISLREKEYDELATQVASLREAAAKRDGEFAGFAKAFEAALNSGAVDAGQMIPRGSGAVTVPATARGLTGVPLNVTVNAGDLVRFEVSGKWKASCGVQAYGQRFAPPADLGAGETTGEGYLLQTVQNRIVATAERTVNEDGTFKTDYSTERKCAGVSAGFSFFGSGFSSSLEKCNVHDKGRSTRQTVANESSSSSSTSQSVPVTTGLRVEGTPYPELPAGALVLQIRNQAGDVVDARVLRPVDAIVAPTSGSLSVMANDTACDGASGALTVVATRFETVGSAAQKLGTAMGTALNYVRAEASTLTGQGEILPSDAARIRGEALGKARLACDCEPTAFPPALKDVFDRWLTNEINRAEALVAIRRRDFRRDQIVLEVSGLRTQSELVGTQSYLAAMLPRWSLRRLDGRFVRASMNALATTLVQDIGGFALVRYPELKTRVIADDNVRKQLEALRDVKLEDDVLLLGSKVAEASASVLDAYKKLYDNSPTKDRRPSRVVIAFAQPNAPAATLSPFPKADPITSRAVWTALKTTKGFSTVVSPETLYRASGLGYVPCTDAAPMIRGAVAIFTGSTGDSDRGVSLGTSSATAEAVQVVPTSEQLLSVRVNAPTWLQGSVDTFRMSAAGVQGFFLLPGAPGRLEVPASMTGNSVFAPLSFDLSGIAQQQPGSWETAMKASELLLLFEIDAVDATRDQLGRSVAACRSR